jgi:CPA1 family monovalent cation:H+ antiporter
LTRYRIADQELRNAIPGLRIAAITSLAGVRGAITLAAVLSVPYAMNDGTAFPARDLIIFLAAGVIICSLLVATVGLPLALQHTLDDGYEHEKREEREARTAIAKAESVRLVALEPREAPNGSLPCGAAIGPKSYGTSLDPLLG